MRKVGATLRESCWQLTLDILSKWQLLEFCKVNVSNFTVRLPNDSVLLFRGLDNPEKIKSITGITDIWAEECTEFTIEDISQLDLRLRANAECLQMFFSFNPVSKSNWVFRRWFEGEVSSDTIVTKSTYKDNPHLPNSYISSLEEMIRTNPTYYKIYALGEFCSLDKLVFSNYTVQDFDFRDCTGVTCIGMDFGFSNDLSTVVASIVDEKQKKMWVFKTWGDVGKDNEQLANVIKSLGFSKSTIICDSSEPKSISELKKYGVSRCKGAVKGPDSIIHGIQRLQQFEIVVHPSCEGLIEELENYSWCKDRATGEYINKPIDQFNHFIDALRYSLQCIGTGLKTLNKSALGL